MSAKSESSEVVEAEVVTDVTVNELPMCQHCYRETQGLPPLKELRR